MSEVILHTKFDVSNLNYVKPINQQNIYYSAIDYKDNPCYIQSTKLVVEDINNENNQMNSSVYSIPPSYNGLYYNPVHEENNDTYMTLESEKDNS